MKNDWSSKLHLGLVPYDGVPIKKNVTVHIANTVVITTFASFGVLFAFICLLFNFLFRNSKQVHNDV